MAELETEIKSFNMKRFTNKVFFVAILSFIAVNSYANFSGKCGTNVMWDYDINRHILNISGSGPMYDYDTHLGMAPWWWEEKGELRTDIKTIIISEGVTTIGDLAFMELSSLTFIVIPNSVEKIGFGAFYGCHSLPYISIPNSVTTIYSQAFQECTALTYITLPNSVVKVSKSVFEDCTALKEIYYPRGLDISSANIPSSAKCIAYTPSSYTINVDQNIPLSKTKNGNTFVVIISNENYSKADEHISNVPFAINDGKIFHQYCLQTLGVSEENIRDEYDATIGKMKRLVNWVSEISSVYQNLNIIFYYSGHGIPDEDSHASYLLPIDGFPGDLSTCYKLEDLYATLGKLNNANIMLFLDACFSGSNRGDGTVVVNSRSALLKAKQGVPQGNMVAFSAAHGNESAYPYEEKQHGMFTFFLLKKIQDTKGELTLGELSNFISTSVKQQSLLRNDKKQEPSIIVSPQVQNQWQNWKLK